MNALIPMRPHQNQPWDPTMIPDLLRTEDTVQLKLNGHRVVVVVDADGKQKTLTPQERARRAEHARGLAARRRVFLSFTQAAKLADRKGRPVLAWIENGAGPRKFRVWPSGHAQAMSSQPD